MTLPMIPQRPLGGNIPGEGPLRDGGAPPRGPFNPADNLPDRETPVVAGQRGAVELVRDLWEGTGTVRGKGQVYLPREPGEDIENYGTRLRRSVFYNVFRHTVEGLAGFIFRKDPVLGSDVPDKIRAHWENIDNAGTHGDVFTRALLTDAMTSGHAGILVEYPDTGTVPLTLADEQDLSIRPYWVFIKKDDIISFRMVTHNGREKLTQMVLRESVYAPAGDYGETLVTHYRVLWIDATGTPRWRVESVDTNKTIVLHSQGVFANQSEIPLAEVPTSGRMSAWVSRPQFLDLAYLNVAHYQQWSDYATCIHKTNVPIFVTSGVELAEGERIVIGPNVGLNFSAPDAKAYYVSHDGAALAATKASLDALKNDMASLGLAALANSKRVAETATAKEIDKSASDASLSVTARGIQDAIEQAFYYHARYLGLDDGGSIQINREFGDTRIGADDVMAWAALSRSLGVPLMTVLSALRTGGWLPDDADLDLIAAQAVKNLAAQFAAQAIPAATDPISATSKDPSIPPATVGQDPATISADGPSVPAS